MRNGLITYKREMKMFDNKKGVTIQVFVIGFIILLGLLIFVAIFVFNVFQKAGEPIEILPDKLSQKAFACQNAINQQNFCQFADVGKKKGTSYVNCAYGDPDFKASIGDAIDRYSCDDGTTKKYCIELVKDKDFELAEINSIDCRQADKDSVASFGNEGLST